jgi:hypothetical protein
VDSNRRELIARYASLGVNEASEHTASKRGRKRRLPRVSRAGAQQVGGAVRGKRLLDLPQRRQKAGDPDFDALYVIARKRTQRAIRRGLRQRHTS